MPIPNMTEALTPDMIKRYGVNGPRYTSYPTAMQFDARFGVEEYAWSVDHSNEDPVPKPLSLYVHIPFCHSLCYYCGCHKIITNNSDRVSGYLDDLNHEIVLRSEGFDDDREVRQIHFGGGTPTYISESEMERLLSTLRRSFKLAQSDMEIAIEIDPREVDGNKLDRLIALGVNRMSFGVQDFDRNVQEAVHRIQSDRETLSLVQHARDQGVGTSVDLIYGLPRQRLDSFMRTLEQVLRVRPSRIALYHYAHMPQRIKAQKLINEAELPSSDEKLAIFCASMEALLEAGYVHIGMDHFALPDDPLVQCAKFGTLHRNFQGYSTHGDCDLVGFGVSAISKIADSFSQNTKQTRSYHDVLASNALPIEKGYCLTEDDVIRADLIQHLMCQKALDYASFGAKHQIHVRHYFAEELARLADYAKDGLLRMDLHSLIISELGIVLLRNIAMVFDIYLPKSDIARHTRFSKVL